MKFKKIIFSVIVMTLIVAYKSVMAFATPTDDIKAALIKGGVPADQISKVIEYIQRYDITEEQANQIIAKIDSAGSKAKGQKDLSKLDPATRNAIKKDIVDAINYLGLKADFSNKSNNGSSMIVVTDGEGSKIASSDTKSSNATIKNIDVSAIKDAVIEVKAFSQDPENATFVPISEGLMRKTGTNYGNLMLLGMGLMLFGALLQIFYKAKLNQANKLVKK